VTRRFPLLLAIACAALLALPASAFAWKYVFGDFIGTKDGAVFAAHASAKKCSGGKLGTYKLVSRGHASGGETELNFEVRADLPVTRKWKQLRDVNLSFQASDNYPPEVLVELVNAYTDFWENNFVRWSPGKLHIRHQGLVVFGQQILAPDEHKEKFKPKKGC
jgi:hypothetical protein